MLGLALQGDYLQLLLVEAPFPCQQVLCILPPIEQNVFACRQVPEKQQHEKNVALFHHAVEGRKEGRKEGREEGKEEGKEEMFYLTTHATHFIYGYMASDLW